MFKRSMLSVALVATVVCQSVQAVDAAGVPSEAVVSYAGSAKKFVQDKWASVANSVSANVSSVANSVSTNASSAASSVSANVSSAASSVSANVSSAAGFVRNVFSPSNHKDVFSAMNRAYDKHGFTAAGRAFFKNKAAVVATGLTLTAVAAACYVAYSKYFSSSDETN